MKTKFFIIFIFLLQNSSFSQTWGVHLKRIEGNGNGGNTLDWLPQFYDSAIAQSRVFCPVYDYFKTPVKIEFYDTTLIVSANKFFIKFDGESDSAKWKIYRIGYTDTVYSDSTIGVGNVQLIPQWGMEVQAKQVKNPGDTASINNGFLGATMHFLDTTKKWLTALPDQDGVSISNWIRSGTSSATPYQDYVTLDDNKVYQGVLGGTWAPYRLTACSTNPFNPTSYYTGPGYNLNYMPIIHMKDLASIDVVFTSDKTKWTRCDVLEMCESITYSQGGARKLDKRKVRSVDKNGNSNSTNVISANPNDPNYIDTVGMGWFPGYAVNLETGERLNIAFSENSALVNENGNDMLWNPTQNQTAAYNLPWDTVNQPIGGPVFGGQHYIYIFGHNNPHTFPSDVYNVPYYDAGKFMDSILSFNGGQPSALNKRGIYRDAMWVNIPLLATGHNLLETDVTVKLRVAKPYSKGYSPVHSDTCAIPQNRNFPMYEFDANNFSLLIPSIDFMEGISVYPNPSTGIFTIFNEHLKLKNVEIYNLLGEKTFQSVISNLQSVIDISSQPKGMYFVRIATEKGIITRKIILE